LRGMVHSPTYGVPLYSLYSAVSNGDNESHGGYCQPAVILCIAALAVALVYAGIIGLLSRRKPYDSPANRTPISRTM
jgi:hypothetical protein